MCLKIKREGKGPMSDSSCVYILFSEKYQKLESEKKTKRPIKKVFSEPTVEYNSLRIPIIEDVTGKM